VVCLCDGSTSRDVASRPGIAYTIMEERGARTETIWRALIACPIASTKSASLPEMSSIGIAALTLDPAEPRR
jgi:hypothetical protein